MVPFWLENARTLHCFSSRAGCSKTSSTIACPGGREGRDAIFIIVVALE